MTQIQSQSCCETSDSTKRIYIDQEICTACGMCAEVCPFGLPVKSETGKYKISNISLCTDCSACQKNCPVEAVYMKEKAGCGCLWDVARRKNSKNSSPSSCCG